MKLMLPPAAFLIQAEEKARRLGECVCWCPSVGALAAGVAGAGPAPEGAAPRGRAAAGFFT
jgi:hypothetical protein